MTVDMVCAMIEELNTKVQTERGQTELKKGDIIVRDLNYCTVLEIVDSVSDSYVHTKTSILVGPDGAFVSMSNTGAFGREEKNLRVVGNVSRKRY